MNKQETKDMSIMDKGIEIVDGGYILAEDTLANAYEKLWAKNPKLRAQYERNMAWLKQPLTNSSPILNSLISQMELTRKSLGVR